MHKRCVVLNSLKYTLLITPNRYFTIQNSTQRPVEFTSSECH